MSDSFISVGQLNTYIRNIFESEIMLQNICVYGEVSSYNISNGIAYFNLKDESGLLACVLFGANNFAKPNLGDMVLVRGSMSYYQKGGKLSFNAISIMPYGKGLLYEKFLALKDKLERSGYFDSARKRQLPSRVKRIGVVSSPTGAVIRDIIDVSHRRNDSLDIVLFPAKVQGVGADIEIAKGIDFFSDYDGVDVVIVARGGGSLEDLEPFNSEIVAESVFKCKKVVVSAVGHETDYTIIDFVADLRAPTPSAAAELVAWSKSAELEKITESIYCMERLLLNKIALYSKDIDILFEKIDNMSIGLAYKIQNNIDLCVNRLVTFDKFVDVREKGLDRLSAILEGNNPQKLSKMGYSKLMQKGNAISSKGNIDKKEDVIVSLIDGDIICKVIG